MKFKQGIMGLFVAAVLSTGCARYAIHGEGVFTDSGGITITNSLYRVETKRLLWFDNKGDIVWLVTKGRPSARLQFDEVPGITPLAAEVERGTATQVIESEYSTGDSGSEVIAGVIENCDSIPEFKEGVANVLIFTEYKSGWGDVAGFNHGYLAPSATPYPFEIERHNLKDKSIPDWVRSEIE